MMEEFFKVKSPAEVIELRRGIARVGTETVPLPEAWGRVLAEAVVPGENLPPFARSTMDGFAVQAASTFGASESNPAYLEVLGSVAMGELPDFAVGSGQAARISTGGMLPRGADAVVMIEHTAAVDDTMIEVYRSVAPGGHVIRAGEDYARGQEALPAGIRLRAQETGLLAALGQEAVKVYRRPVVGIISTGDEVVPISRRPGPGQIRDVNSYSLGAMVQGCGGRPRGYGIVADNFDALSRTLARAADECDMLLISGVYYPIEVLPDALQKIAVLSPATYVLVGVREALLLGTPTRQLWPYIWPVLLMGAVAIPAGLKIFGLAERYAKRTGKLHRNG